MSLMLDLVIGPATPTIRLGGPLPSPSAPPRLLDMRSEPSSRRGLVGQTSELTLELEITPAGGLRTLKTTRFSAYWYRLSFAPPIPSMRQTARGDRFSPRPRRRSDRELLCTILQLLNYLKY